MQPCNSHTTDCSLTAQNWLGATARSFRYHLLKQIWGKRV